MILSRREYTWAGATLEQQRALSPSWIVRRCRFDGLFEDERPLKTLGRDIESSRARLSVILAGRTAAFAGENAWDLAEGDAVLVAPLGNLFIADVYSSTSFELDWEVGPSASFREEGRVRAGPIRSSGCR
jgi:hypothetical protein